MYKVTSNLKLKVQGVIKVFPVGSVIKLPEKSAQMFIQQGKIEPIKDEHFLNVFQGTVNKMADKYKDGLFDYTRSQNPEKYEQFNQVENRINKYWNAGNFESFQKELDNWKGIYFELLKLFKVKND